MDMVWLFLLLAHLLVTESEQKTNSCISQPSAVIWHKTAQTAFIPCTLSQHCSANLHWFVVKERSHERLIVTGNHRISLNGSSLQITSLNTNDSGIYHCAAAPGEPPCCTHHVGDGVTLVVREHVKIMVRHVLLWLSFVLLVVYSLAVVTLLILKKYGCKVGKMHKIDKNTLNKKTQFHNVLKEMSSRQNLEKQKETEQHPQTEDFNSSTDAIYQNV